MNCTLEMSGITKRFPGVTALESVHFTANAGEVVALIGENGAGKSTLMRILAGIHPPDSGQIRFLDRPLLLRSPREATSAGIAIIHQEPELIDNLDIAGNIFLGRERSWGGPARLLDRRKMAADAQPHLERVGLPLKPDTPIAGLSMAQRQLVEIARALSCSARVLIMDEPTSSLTFREAENLFRIVRELSAAGVAVIYISHRLQEITQIADRVTVLRDGRNAGELQRGEISPDLMIRLMVGRKLTDLNS
jgi:ribose transport system ATP-binding protein